MNATSKAEITPRKLLLDQFDIAWSLADYHLGSLSTEECLWRPTRPGLHVHRHNDGIWLADWPEIEGYDIGLPSIAWTTWHICYWWTNAIAGMNGKPVVDRADIAWPGSAEQTRTAIEGLRARWRSVVEGASENDLEEIKAGSWPMPNCSVAGIAAWLNLELMKNAAEIGAIRFLYATRQNRGA